MAAGGAAPVFRAIGKWYLLHRLKGWLKSLGLTRAERKATVDFVRRFLTLDFTALKGWRTAIGVLTYAADALAGSAFCTTHPEVCTALKGISGWFLAMGIRGK
jgi:hypothetical protein